MKYLFSVVVLYLFTTSTSFGLIGEPRQSDTLKFAVVTDTHIGKPGNDKGLAAIVRDINDNPKIDFVLHAGDVSDFGDEDQLEEAKRLMDGLDKPYYIVPGNHDTGWSSSGGLIYDKLWEDQKFLEDIGGVRFIGLSTGPYGRMTRGYVPLDQMRWLDSLVQVTPKDQPVVLLTHYPLDDKMSNYEELIDKLKKLNTVAVFVGHGHVNRIYDFGGITGIMTRTAQLRESTLAYNSVLLTQDSVQVKMVEVGGPENDFWASLSLHQSGAEDKVVNKSTNTLPDHSGVRALWTYQDEGNIVATPAVWENSVLVGNLLGDFKSINGETGKVNWEFSTGQPIYSSPEVSDNKVIFGSADSIVYCLNPQNGDLIWKVKTEAPVLASPIIEDGRVFIGSSDLQFRALDLNTGEILWSYANLAGFPASKPTIAEGKIVFGIWGKTMYALNVNDGTLAWEWVNKDYSHYYSPAICIPVIQNEKVYIVAPDEKLREFDLHTGQQTYETAEFKVRESIGGHAENDWLVAKTMQDTIVAWSTQNDEPEVLFKISGDYGWDFSASMPVFQDNSVFFGTTFGRVYAIDMKEEKVEWFYQLSEDMVNTPQPYTKGKVLATSVNGKIVLLEAF